MVWMHAHNSHSTEYNAIVYECLLIIGIYRCGIITLSHMTEWNLDQTRQFVIDRVGTGPNRLAANKQAFH